MSNQNYRPVGRVVTHLFLEREMSSNLGSVKSDTVLPTAGHRCDISLKKGAVLPVSNIAGMDPANSLHAAA